MTDTSTEKAKIFNMPQTRAELVARKTIKADVRLADLVDQIFTELWDDPTFRALWNATSKHETVEGTFVADSYVSAQRIRDYAKAHEISRVIDARLPAIRAAQSVVANRYHVGRKDK